MRLFLALDLSEAAEVRAVSSSSAPRLWTVSPTDWIDWRRVESSSSRVGKRSVRKPVMPRA